MLLIRIKNIARKKGYKIFTDPYKLNIWGIRSKSTVPNTFNDTLYVFYKDFKRRWIKYTFQCTTDPGTYWLNNPIQPQGTAILAPGQYIDTYKIDRHRAKYYALCQRLKKVKIIRDYNRNARLDFYNGSVHYGMFGINIHRARKTGETLTVDKHSAGCQVFKRASDFNLFMKLCEMHRKFHQNRFSYTLIDQRMEFRQSIKGLLIGTIAATALIGVGLWLNEKANG